MILGRPSLNKIEAIISTTYLMMKFFVDNGEIATLKVDQVAGRRTYNASLKVSWKKIESKDEARPSSSSKVMIVKLDAKERQERGRREPNGELEVVQIG